MVSDGTDIHMGSQIVFQNDGASAFNSGLNSAAVVGAPVGFVGQKLFSEERERYFLGRGDFRRGMLLEGGERCKADDSVDQEASRNWRLDGRQWRPRSRSDSGDDDQEEKKEEEEEEEEDDDDEGGGNGRGLGSVKDRREPVAARVSSGSDGGEDSNNNSRENGSNICNDSRGSNSGVIVQCSREGL